MARGRLISRTLGSSRKFTALARTAGNLGEFAQLLYPLLISNSDDHGRMAGDAFTIKFAVFPTSPRSEDEFDTALNAMHDARLIERYTIDDVQLLQILEFDAHQPGLHKRTESKFPGSSGKFPEIPSESNIRESKGRESKGRESKVAREKGEVRQPHPLDEDPIDPNQPVLSSVPDVPSRAGAPDSPVLTLDRFLDAYPRKDDRMRATASWNALRADSELVEVILADIAKRVRMGWAEDPAFVPKASRYLDERQWQEPYVVRRPKPADQGCRVPDVAATAAYMAEMKSDPAGSEAARLAFLAKHKGAKA